MAILKTESSDHIRAVSQPSDATSRTCSTANSVSTGLLSRGLRTPSPWPRPEWPGRRKIDPYEVPDSEDERLRQVRSELSAFRGAFPRPKHTSSSFTGSHSHSTLPKASSGDSEQPAKRKYEADQSPSGPDSKRARSTTSQAEDRQANSAGSVNGLGNVPSPSRMARNGGTQVKQGYHDGSPPSEPDKKLARTTSTQYEDNRPFSQRKIKTSTTASTPNSAGQVRFSDEQTATDWSSLSTHQALPGSKETISTRRELLPQFGQMRALAASHHSAAQTIPSIRLPTAEHGSRSEWCTPRHRDLTPLKSALKHSPAQDTNMPTADYNSEEAMADAEKIVGELKAQTACMWEGIARREREGAECGSDLLAALRAKLTAKKPTRLTPIPKVTGPIAIDGIPFDDSTDDNEGEYRPPSCELSSAPKDGPSSGYRPIDRLHQPARSIRELSVDEDEYWAQRQKDRERQQGEIYASGLAAVQKRTGLDGAQREVDAARRPDDQPSNMRTDRSPANKDSGLLAEGNIWQTEEGRLPAEDSGLRAEGGELHGEGWGLQDEDSRLQGESSGHQDESRNEALHDLQTKIWVTGDKGGVRSLQEIVILFAKHGTAAFM